MDRFEVEDVEPSYDGPVEQDRPNPVERTEGADEGEDPAGPVRTIDPDVPGAHRLEPFGNGHHHGGDRGVPVRTVERSVVDADHLGVGFTERPPQR